MSTTIDYSSPVSGEDELSNPDVAEEERLQPLRKKSHRGLGWWILGGAVIVVGAGLWLMLSGGNGDGDAVATGSLEFSEVVVTDLVKSETFDGTLGTIDGDPVKSSLAGTITYAAEAGTTAEEGDTLFAIDGVPVMLGYGVTPMYRSLAATEDLVEVAGRSNGTVTSVVEVGTAIEQGDVLYTVDGNPVVLLYGDTPAYRALRDARDNLEGTDVLQLETALDALGYNSSGSLSVDGEFTDYTEDLVEDWQADIGAPEDGSVDLGEVVFLPGPVTVLEVSVVPGASVNDGRAVMTVTGTSTTTGEDVRQLELALEAFGFDADGALSVDGVFDEATTAAVMDWQAAIGAVVDGVVDVGDIVFLAGPVRVSEQLASPGASVNPGSEVLAISSSDKVVSVSLPAADQGIAVAGDAVTVELPDHSEVPATVNSVATVATATSSGGPVFEMVVSLDDPTVAGSLDEAPVDVEIVTDRAEDVLAVPVAALVALAEGGYAVEVDAGGGAVRLVGVETGFYAGGLVEITSSGLEPGDRVVVP